MITDPIVLIFSSRRVSGPVWQHQFRERFVRHEKEFAARFDDRRLNPVKKGLVSKPEQGCWSKLQ
jgi:hypothetical protein